MTALHYLGLFAAGLAIGCALLALRAVVVSVAALRPAEDTRAPILATVGLFWAVVAAALFVVSRP